MEGSVPMEELIQLKEKLDEERPVRWIDFPDIGLYKDQVVSYMYRQLIHFEEEGHLTSAMINNYIKGRLLPRAEGKKYNREHLAGLTEICVLKQILSVENAGFLLHQELQGDNQETFYEKFCNILDQALTETSAQIHTDWDAGSLSDIVLRLAVSSYCQKLVCERLLEIIRNREEGKGPEDPKEANRKRGKKREKEQEKKQDDNEIRKQDDNGIRKQDDNEIRKQDDNEIREK